MTWVRLSEMWCRCLVATLLRVQVECAEQKLLQYAEAAGVEIKHVTTEGNLCYMRNVPKRNHKKFWYARR